MEGEAKTDAARLEQATLKASGVLAAMVAELERTNVSEGYSDNFTIPDARRGTSIGILLRYATLMCDDDPDKLRLTKQAPLTAAKALLVRGVADFEVSSETKNT